MNKFYVKFQKLHVLKYTALKILSWSTIKTALILIISETNCVPLNGKRLKKQNRA